MKQLGPIAIVVILLLGAAAYYNHQQPAEAGQLPYPAPEYPTTAAVAQPVEHIALLSTSAADHGTLTLKSAISHGYIAPSNHGELYAAIDITATETKNTSRPPLNVSLVIDRSGSMGVEAMGQARDAAKKFVDHLDHRDRVSIVSFSRDVRV
ncbi:MAG: VWA domain-containing protein, partial [Bradymonadaceae bacterium]